MLWQSFFSTSDDVEDCLKQCREKLQGLRHSNVVFFFVSAAFYEDYGKIRDSLGDTFSKARILGCSASGLIGTGVEAEFKPGLSVLAGYVPNAKVDLFHLEHLPELDGPPEAWRKAVAPGGDEVKALVLLADPFSMEVPNALSGLDFAFPHAVKVGGVASGCRVPGDAALFVDAKTYSSGLCGAVFSGDIEVMPVVAQGCLGVGKQYVVTESQNNVILKLDGQSATDALTETLQSLSPEQREAYLTTNLFIGLGAGGPALEYRPGEFLVRQVVATSRERGAIAVGGAVRNGQTVQFHFRNAQTSRKDLLTVLERARQNSGAMPGGALAFSCLGRGEGLYGKKHHDSQAFGEVFGPIPLSGFFCNGEIGPVGSETCLHGFTTSFAVFCSG